MSILNKQWSLVLNAMWVPVGYNSIRKSITSLTSDGANGIAAKAVDIELKKDENGEWDYDNPVAVRDVSWDEWVTLPIREYDEVIQSARFQIRAPTVIIAVNFSKIPMRSLKPNKKRIMEKYNYTCIYSGKKLPASSLNIDHLTPKSKGGKDNWHNLAPCDKKINFAKGDKTIKEAGLRTQYPLSAPRPVPASVLIHKANHPTWRSFLIRRS